MPGRQRPRVLVLLALVIGVAGCSSSGTPQMSGFGLGDTRTVTVGETVDLRLPLRPDGTREWRVTSYDSLYLGVAGRPRVVEGRGGRPELLVRARARAPGETVVEVTELATGNVVSFRVRIDP